MNSTMQQTQQERRASPRLIPVEASPRSRQEQRSLTEVIGYQFKDQSLEDVAASLVDDARNGIQRQVFFVNAHCINVAARNEAYDSVLRSAPWLYADGAGMAVASRIWGQPLKHNVNGTDLFPILCKNAARHDVPIALLGACPGVAEACARRLHEACPNLRVVSSHHGYLSPEEEQRMLEEIHDSGARILLVAKGVPKQELWMRQNAGKINVPVLIGVGALFDFYSGSLPRAPLLMRRLRLEWLFRLLMEPRRLFRRYVIGNPEFLFRVLKARFSGGTP